MESFPSLNCSESNPSHPSRPAERRRLLRSLLGRLPDSTGPISATVLEVRELDFGRVEKLRLDLNGMEPVCAWFSAPREAPERVPAILYTHAHGGDYALGKDEFIRGRSALQSPPYAEALARRGWAGLCIDLSGFGERSGRAESTIFKEMLWRGRALWGMMVFDTLRALDYLAGRPDVDPKRIGAMGLSMGSTMSWWIAALDERVKVCVDLCCLTDFDALLARDGLDLHGLYYFVPDLLTHFTTASINELIAPRPHLSLAGIHDPLTPPEGLDRIDTHLRAAYQAAGAAEAWRLSRYDAGHQETPAMREEILAWLERWI
jgi:dienelactone hydrolase